MGCNISRFTVTESYNSNNCQLGAHHSVAGSVKACNITIRSFAQRLHIIFLIDMCCCELKTKTAFTLPL